MGTSPRFRTTSRFVRTLLCNEIYPEKIVIDQDTIGSIIKTGYWMTPVVLLTLSMAHFEQVGQVPKTLPPPAVLVLLSEAMLKHR